MNEVVVRKAKSTDATRVAELSGILGYPVDRETMQRRLERLDGREEHVIFVGEISGKVVGWIHGAERELLAHQSALAATEDRGEPGMRDQRLHPPAPRRGPERG